MFVLILVDIWLIPVVLGLLFADFRNLHFGLSFRWFGVDLRIWIAGFGVGVRRKIRFCFVCFWCLIVGVWFRCWCLCLLVLLCLDYIVCTLWDFGRLFGCLELSVLGVFEFSLVYFVGVLFMVATLFVLVFILFVCLDEVGWLFVFFVCLFWFCNFVGLRLCWLFWFSLVCLFASCLLMYIVVVVVDFDCLFYLFIRGLFGYLWLFYFRVMCCVLGFNSVVSFAFVVNFNLVCDLFLVDLYLTVFVVFV